MNKRIEKMESKKRPLQIGKKTFIMLSPGARVEEVSDHFLSEVKPKALWVYISNLE